MSDFHVLGGYGSEQYDFRFRNGRLVSEFRRGLGLVNATIDRKEIPPGKWFHLAASFGDENKVYFNGQFLAGTQVMNKSRRRGSGRAPHLALMSRSGSPAIVSP